MDEGFNIILQDSLKTYNESTNIVRLQTREKDKRTYRLSVSYSPYQKTDVWLEDFDLCFESESVTVKTIAYSGRVFDKIPLKNFNASYLSTEIVAKCLNKHNVLIGNINMLLSKTDGNLELRREMSRHFNRNSPELVKLIDKYLDEVRSTKWIVG